MLYAPELLTAIADQAPAMQPFRAAIQAIAVATREALGEEHLAWLRALPHKQTHGPIALLHASPDSFWLAPAHYVVDAELEAAFAPLKKPGGIRPHTSCVHPAFAEHDRREFP